MARAVIQAESERGETPARRFTVIRGFGGGPPSVEVRQPIISNGQIGILVLIAFEIMVFAGLVSAYVVLRTASFAWPPPDLPRLPLAVTWANTAVLVFSAFSMWRATRAIHAGQQDRLRSALVATAILGGVFLGVQGSEWVRLIHRGLTLASSTYGATFYTLIGLHALHVVGGVVALLAVLWLAHRGSYSAKQHVGVSVCATYWYFVCALWLVLFPLVYLY